MSPEEMIERIDVYIDQYITDSEGKGSIFRVPYKDPFFNIFLLGYQKGYLSKMFSPHLTGAALMKLFTKKWNDLDNEYKERKIDLIKKLLFMWNEWFYVLEKTSHVKIK